MMSCFLNFEFSNAHVTTRASFVGFGTFRSVDVWPPLLLEMRNDAFLIKEELEDHEFFITQWYLRSLVFM